jgi:hypothetical protein
MSAHIYVKYLVATRVMATDLRNLDAGIPTQCSVDSPINRMQISMQRQVT